MHHENTLADVPIDSKLSAIGPGSELEDMLERAWNFMTELDETSLFATPVIINH
jgi:hypothetical protein